ncbi:MAG: nitrite reductase small subunit NirD [Verrucomicrobia bacterium]|nr:nitrite reductase small subunit NirD [Verrucomicrobiota bacterium]
MNVIRLGNIEKIQRGQGRCFVVNGAEIAVFRQRDGRFFAIQNRCPHRQGPLAEGLVGDGKVICPLHAHKFDLVTGAGAEPSEYVKVYAAREQDGEILLMLSAENN